MKGGHHVELAKPGSSIRLCLELEKKFPDLRGYQLELLKRLCLIAYDSQDHIPLHIYGDAWLRTTISLNPENDPHHVFSAQSTECKEMARIMNLNRNVREAEHGRLIRRLVMPEITSKIEIRSNILPGGAYLERLQDLQRQSCWTKVQTMLMGTSCCLSRRGFFPKNILISHFEISGNVRYYLAKVADFGCAQFIVPGQNLRIRGGIGTYAYSAPEVLRRERDFEYPEKMDVFSFGAVAYEVLTGHAIYDGRLLTRRDLHRIIAGKLRPSDSETWKTLIKKHRYPLELINLVEQCWKLRPQDRPSFSEICPKLKECKSTVKRWEKLSAAFWSFFTVCLFAFVCNLLLQLTKFV